MKAAWSEHLLTKGRNGTFSLFPGRWGNILRRACCKTIVINFFSLSQAVD